MGKYPSGREVGKASQEGGPRESAPRPGVPGRTASIWSTAAIGIAAGLGHYTLAVGATALQLIILHSVARLERRAPTLDP